MSSLMMSSRFSLQSRRLPLNPCRCAVFNQIPLDEHYKSLFDQLVSSTSYRNGIIPEILWGPCLLFRPKHTTPNIRTFLFDISKCRLSNRRSRNKILNWTHIRIVGPEHAALEGQPSGSLKFMASQRKTWIIHLQACLMLSRTFLHVNVQAPDSQSYESFMLRLCCLLKMSLSPKQTHAGVRFYFVHALGPHSDLVTFKPRQPHGTWRPWNPRLPCWALWRQKKRFKWCHG